MNETPITADDWKKAKERFDTVRSQYQELEGVPGVNTTFALRAVFDPISKRYDSGERTKALYDEMISVE